MGRIRAVGPVSLGSGTAVEITSWAKYDVNYEATIVEVENANSAAKTTLHANAGWTASVEIQLPTVGRTLATGISIGSWTGAGFQDWSLNVEADLKEATGKEDDWKQFLPVSYSWTVDAKRWEATASVAVFKALLQTQAATTYPAVAFVSPYGSGNVLLDKAAFERSGSDLANENMSCKGSGALTSTDAYVLLLTNAVDAVVEAGTATALTFDVPEGGGSCWLKSVKFAVPAADKVTVSLELQGSGAWADGS